MKLKVFRFTSGMTKPRYDTFSIGHTPGKTVLSALFEAQSRYDDSLAFRYSCRGAVCGTCAMLINRVPRLACRTQMAALLSGALDLPLSHYDLPYFSEPWDKNEEVIVEPLPNLPLIKDLIVDMETFFTRYRAIGPVFKPGDPDPEKERFMTQKAVRELEQYTTCILCAACFAACPVNGKNPRYTGPAALAKLYRFRIDPREQEGSRRLATADHPDGWWACEFHTNCRRVCPKGVPPDKAIGHARQELTKMKKEAKEHEETGA
jgi:succinate dehydrogenase / fumarate reductase iron-sulfur subunit